MNGLSSAGTWNYRTSNWIPDAVLIVLGGNDIDEGDDSPSEVLMHAIVHLLNKIATNYAHAVRKPKLVPVCGNSGSRGGLENVCDDMATAVHRFNNQSNTTGFKAYYKAVTKSVFYHANNVNTTTDDDAIMDARVGFGPYNGCGSHYNAEGDRIIMHDFLPHFHKVLGWR